jgi:hypothetical protein
MSDKVAVQLISSGSVVVIAASLLFAVVIYNDINTLYVDIMRDIADFRVHSEDAWQKMMVVQSDKVESVIFY